MPRGKLLAGGDGDLEWELLPDDVFVPRRGRGRVDLAGAMARRLGSRKRHRHAGDVFVPRRAPRGGPPADPGILVVRSRVHEPRRSLPSEPRELLVEPPPATWDGVPTPPRRRRAVRDHDTGVEGDPTEARSPRTSRISLDPASSTRGGRDPPSSARGGAELARGREPWTRTLSFRHRGAWTCALRGTTPRRTTGPSTTRTFSPKRIPRTKRRWLSRDDVHGPRARRSV